MVVHGLAHNRLFLVALAALMLLAFMPWQGALHCQGDTQGDTPSGGEPCCCCAFEQAPPSGNRCCAPADPGPGESAPCPCIQVGKTLGLPPTVAPEGGGQEALALHPAPGTVIAAVVPAAARARVLRPPARNGPLLHLRMQVLLI